MHKWVNEPAGPVQCERCRRRTITLLSDFRLAVLASFAALEQIPKAEGADATRTRRSVTTL